MASEQESMEEHCFLLIYGYSRSDSKLPMEIVQLITSYYWIWFSLKLINCGGEFGDKLDINKYETKLVSIDSNLTLRKLARDIGDKMLEKELKSIRRRW